MLSFVASKNINLSYLRHVSFIASSPGFFVGNPGKNPALLRSAKRVVSKKWSSSLTSQGIHLATNLATSSQIGTNHFLKRQTWYIFWKSSWCWLGFAHFFRIEEVGLWTLKSNIQPSEILEFAGNGYRLQKIGQPLQRKSIGKFYFESWVSERYGRSLRSWFTLG